MSIATNLQSLLCVSDWLLSQFILLLLRLKEHKSTLLPLCSQSKIWTVLQLQPNETGDVMEQVNVSIFSDKVKGTIHI